MLGKDAKRLRSDTNATTIPAGATVSILNPYEAAAVILTDAASLMPLAGRLFDQTVTTAVNIILGTADKDAMGHALDLVRNIMAAPTSKTAVDLVRAQADATAATDDAEAERIMADFFASHPPYETVTTDRYAMMLSWVQGYAYLWGIDAEGRLGRVYDLQPSPYLGVNGTSLGSIVFSAPAGRAALADPADASSGLNISFTPAGDTARSLSFASGGLGDGDKLSLLGTFCDPTWVATAETTTVLLPVFAGQLNDKTVIAVPATAENSDSSSANEGLSGLDIANLVIGIIGLVSAAFTIFMGLYAFKSYLANKRAKGENLGNRDMAQARLTAREVIALVKKQRDAEMHDAGESDPIPADDDQYASEVDDMRREAGGVLKKVGRAKSVKAIDDMREQVEMTAQITSSPKLQRAASDLVEASESVKSEPSNAVSKIRDATAAMREVLQDNSSSFSEQLIAQMERNIEIVKSTSDQAESIEKEKIEENENGEQTESEEGLFFEKS